MFSLAKEPLLVAAAFAFGCAAVEPVDPDGAAAPEYGQAVSRGSGYFGYGKIATAEEIAGWDIDVRPDGEGLPEGAGSAEEGEMLYDEMCASCHGSFGEGAGRYPALAGGEGTLTHERPDRTVGSYWPYATTLWDYIHRAMPYFAPESLSDDEVYAISAYVLYLNDLIDYEFELTRTSLPLIEMPNRKGFVPDNRPDVVNRICMRNCRDPSTVTIASEPELSSSIVPAVLKRREKEPVQDLQDRSGDEEGAAAVGYMVLQVGERKR